MVRSWAPSCRKDFANAADLKEEEEEEEERTQKREEREKYRDKREERKKKGGERVSGAHKLLFSSFSKDIPGQFILLPHASCF